MRHAVVEPLDLDPRCLFSRLGFDVRGLGFREDLGLGIWGLGSGFGVSGLRRGVRGLGLRFQVLGFGFWGCGFGLGFWGLGFGV